MIEFEDALKLVLKNTRALNAAEAPLEKSIGYVLAEDIKSGLDMPPFNKSAMDGYAARAADLKKPPAQLKCAGTVNAGKSLKRRIKEGECARIMTGAPLPKGCDSVVMMEFTRQGDKPGFVIVHKAAKKWENVCFKAEDVKKGSVILKKGALIRAPEVAAAATAGRARLKVYRAPRVAILNTGDEIVEPGRRLTPQKIYNSNGPMLSSLLSQMGIEPDYLGIARDEEAHLAKLIRRGLKNDILLLSGGVSMGDLDLVPKVLERAGVRKVFHKIRIKPGKPVFFGVRRNSLVFGVPGNPVSTFLTFLALIKPAIEKMMGKPACLDIKKGILHRPYRQKKDKRKHFVPVWARQTDKAIGVFPLKSYHGSADITALSDANAFMIVDGSTAFLKKGSAAEVIIWREGV